MNWESTQCIGTFDALLICFRDEAYDRRRCLEATYEMNQEIAGNRVSRSIVDGDSVALLQQLTKLAPLPPADESRNSCPS
mmetsp:Transcript_17276/g.28269  ORF Transcript_17276/g.28269 Transcript_17276/m.28269 type:complete len:80 (+) Transcript_17276:633-872(+)